MLISLVAIGVSLLVLITSMVQHRGGNLIPILAAIVRILSLSVF